MDGTFDGLKKAAPILSNIPSFLQQFETSFTNKVLIQTNDDIDLLASALANMSDKAKLSALNLVEFKGVEKASALEVLGLTGAIGTATAAQTAWNSALAIGKQLLLGIAAGAIIWGIQKVAEVVDSLIVTYDDLKENASSAKNSWEEQNSTVESLTEQIEALAAAKKDATDPEVISNIERENTALEAQLNLAKALAAQDAATANENAYSVSTQKRYTSTYNPTVSYEGVVLDTPTLDNSEYLSEQIRLYSELDNQLQELYSNWDSGAEHTAKDLETFQQKESALKQQLTDTTAEINSVYQEISDNAQNAIDDDSETYRAIQENFSSASDEYNDFYSRYIEKAEDAKEATKAAFDKQLVLDYLNAVNSQHELKVDSISDPGVDEAVLESWEKLKNAADAAGVSVQQYIKNALEIESVSSVVDMEADNFSALSDELDNIQEAYSLSKQAIEEYNKNGDISIDTLQSLLSLGDDYIAYLVDENGQLMLNEAGLLALANARLDDMKAAALERACNLIQTFTDEETASEYLGESLDDLAKSRTANANAALDEARALAMKQAVANPDNADDYTAIQAAIDKAISVYNAIDAQIESVRGSLGKNLDAGMNYSGVTKSAKEAKSALEQLNDEIDTTQDAYKTLTSAIEEYNTYHTLSIDTLQALSELDEKYQNCLVNENGQLKLNVEAFNALVSKELQQGHVLSNNSVIADLYSDTMQTLADGSYDAATATGELADIELELGYSLNTLSSKLDDIQSAYDTLSAAQEESARYGFMSIDTIQSLLKLNSEYLTCLENEDGQLRSNDAALTALAKTQLENLKRSTSNVAVQEQLDSTLEKLTDGTLNYKDVLSGLGTVLTEITNKMSDLQSAYSTLQTAQKEYSDVGFLTSDTIQKLAQLSPEYLKCLIDEHGQLQLNTDAYKLLATTQLNALKAEILAKENSEDYISVIKMLDDTIEAVSNSTENLDQHLTGLADTSSTLTSVLNKLQSVFSTVLGLIQDGIDEQSDTLKIWGDAIQDEIEAQIDALEKERELQDSVYEAEIKALEEKKDALQAANDEEDRAIKLAQLQDALARARANRTVRKYVEGQGYVWTLDEEAVQDAQQDLSDQMREWDRDDALKAVDDEIAAIEKEQDAYDQAIDAETDKLNELKDKYDEIISLIGTSWDDYQTMLEAQAALQGKTYDQLTSYVNQYKDAVITSMKKIQSIENTNNVISKISTIINLLGDVYDLFTSITGVVNSLGGILGSGSGSSGGGLFSKIIQGAKDTFTNLTDGFKNLISDGKEAASKVASSFIDGTTGAWTKIKNGAQSLSDKLVGDGGIFATIQQKASNLGNSIKNFFVGDNGVWTKIKAGAESLSSRLVGSGGIFETIKSKISAISINIKDFFVGDNGIWSKIANGAKSMGDALVGDNGVFTNLKKKISDFGNGIRDFFVGDNGIWTKIKNGASNLISNIGTLFSNGHSTISSGLNSFVNFISNTFSNGWNSISTGASNLISKIGSLFSNGFSSVSGGVSSFVNKIVSAFSSGWSSISSGTSSFISKIGSLFSNGFSSVSSGVGSFIGKIGSLFSNGWNSIANGATGLLSKIGSLFSSGTGVTSATDAATGFTGKLGSLFSNGWGAIASGASGLISKIGSVFSGGIGAVSGAASGFIGTLGSLFSNGFAGIVSGAASAIGGIGSALSGLGAAASSGVAAAGTALAGLASSTGPVGIAIAGVAALGATLVASGTGIGKNFINGIVNGIGSVANTLWDVIGGITSGVGNAFSGIVNGVGNVVGDLWNAAKDLGSGIWNGVKDAANTAGNIIKDVCTGIGNGIKKVGKGILNFFGFASGTTSVPRSAIYNVDEKGKEIIVRKPASGRYTYLEDGDGVIPADITKRLFEMGGDPDKWFAKQLSKFRLPNTTSSQNSTIVTIGDIHVHKPVGDVEQLSQIFVQQLPNQVKQDLNKR